MGFHGASMLASDADAPAVAAKSRRQSKTKATSAAPPALTCLQHASGAQERSLHSAVLLFDSDPPVRTLPHAHECALAGEPMDVCASEQVAGSERLGFC